MSQSKEGIRKVFLEAYHLYEQLQDRTMSTPPANKEAILTQIQNIKMQRDKELQSLTVRIEQQERVTRDPSRAAIRFRDYQTLSLLKKERKLKAFQYNNKIKALRASMMTARKAAPIASPQAVPQAAPQNQNISGG